MDRIGPSLEGTASHREKSEPARWHVRVTERRNDAPETTRLIPISGDLLVQFADDDLHPAIAGAAFAGIVGCHRLLGTKGRGKHQVLRHTRLDPRPGYFQRALGGEFPVVAKMQVVVMDGQVIGETNL